MQWTYNDGGRKASGFRGDADDCVCRSIAIATGMPYRDVYRELKQLMGHLASGRCRTKISRSAKYMKATGRNSPRNGVYKELTRDYLADIGWRWTPTMAIGQGCKAHLRDGELPTGRLIVSVSKHLTCVIDGVIYDTHDPSRDGTRCVYGYWSRQTEEPKP